MKTPIQNSLKQFSTFLARSFNVKTRILIRAAVIGVVVGLFGVAFRFATDKLNYFFFHGSYKEHWYEWLYLPIICTLGGLTASILTQKLAKDASGSGIPQVKYALNKKGIHIQLRTVITKFIGGVVGIATGLSLGREGPTIQIGAGLGDKITTMLGGKNTRRALAVGAGAGLAAAFNTPIAGVLFVVEELDHDFSSIALGPAIVGAVTAAVTCRLLYGNYFLFHFQTDSLVSLPSLPIYILLGILCGFAGSYFQKAILFSVDFYKRTFTKVPTWAFGGIAGLITGIIGLWIPEAIGGGHVTLEGTLAQAYIWWFIPIIFLFKFLLTTVAYGSGVPGGIFAPSLVMGALAGASIGNFANFVFPDLQLHPASFAFVGMGAFFTAISRAPITSIIMLFELTGNYNLVLPLMFGCIVANVTAEKMNNGSIYHNLLKQAGLEVSEHHDVPYLQRFSVDQVMIKDVETIDDSYTLTQLRELFKRSHHRGFPVMDQSGGLAGVVTKSDVEAAFDDNYDGDCSVREIMSQDIIFAYPGDSLQSVVLQFYEHKVGRVLVIDRKNLKRLLGIITRSDIINLEASVEADL